MLYIPPTLPAPYRAEPARSTRSVKFKDQCKVRYFERETYDQIDDVRIWSVDQKSFFLASHDAMTVANVSFEFAPIGAVLTTDSFINRKDASEAVVQVSGLVVPAEAQSGFASFATAGHLAVVAGHLWKINQGMNVSWLVTHCKQTRNGYSGQKIGIPWTLMRRGGQQQNR